MTPTRPLGLGRSSAHGTRGVSKRLAAIRYDQLTGERLLDIGCGDGTYTRVLAERFSHTDGIDIQDERLALFQPAPSITVTNMSADALRYPDATFDCVTAIEVLEHVDQLDTALSEIHRVLKPGGAFAFTTPNRWFPLETHGPLLFGKRRKPIAAPFLPWIPALHSRCADARSFTRRSLTRRLADAGLLVDQVRYIYPPFDRSRLGRRVAPVTDWLESTPLRVFGMALAVVAWRG